MNKEELQKALTKLNEMASDNRHLSVFIEGDKYVNVTDVEYLLK
jgi:biopolymer transport protein ExbD